MVLRYEVSARASALLASVSVVWVFLASAPVSVPASVFLASAPVSVPVSCVGSRVRSGVA